MFYHTYHDTPAIGFTCPSNDTKWYHISVGYSYGLNKYFWSKQEAGTYDAIDPLKTTTVTLVSGTAYKGHYGAVTLTLSSGSFMHVSLWKKFIPRAQLKDTLNEFFPRYLDP